MATITGYVLDDYNDHRIGVIIGRYGRRVHMLTVKYRPTATRLIFSWEHFEVV